MKTSVQYKLLYGLFKAIGVNKMLDKEGPDFDKLLKSCRKKQEKPLKVPYKKMQGFDIETKGIDGTTCYVVRVKNSSPKKAVLYLFGGGYILPPDPGDIVLCGQIAENCDAEVWFPLYPMTPEYSLAETLQSTLQVYRQMLKKYDAAAIRFFGTSSGGGQAMSLCVYIRHENIDVPLPGRLVLQSPGLQVPPSESQKAEMERRRKADVMIPPGFFDAIAPVLATGDEVYLSERKILVDKIINMMKQGDFFHNASEWDRAALRPQNPLSKIWYRGSNRMKLMAVVTERKYRNPRWATAKQLFDKGYRIKAGEHGTICEKWIFEKEKKTKDEYGNIVKEADGSFMYMGNNILNDGINDIPSYQYRIRPK